MKGLTSPDVPNVVTKIFKALPCPSDRLVTTAATPLSVAAKNHGAPFQVIDGVAKHQKGPLIYT